MELTAAKNNHQLEAPTLAENRPQFGHLAKELVGLAPALLESGLEQQRKQGGRIGDILCDRGALRRRTWRCFARWKAAKPTVLPGSPA